MGRVTGKTFDPQKNCVLDLRILLWNRCGRGPRGNCSESKINGVQLFENMPHCCGNSSAI